MKASEIRAAVLQWCEEDRDLKLIESQAEHRGFRVRVRSKDGSPVDLVGAAEDADSVTARHTFTVPAASVGVLPGDSDEERERSLLVMVDMVALARSGPLGCTGKRGATGVEVAITYPLYGDGFSRQSLMMALWEIEKAHRQIEGTLALWGAENEELRRLKAEAGGPAQPSAPEGTREPPAPAEGQIRCPKCGAVVPPGSRFCTKCGSPVAPP